MLRNITLNHITKIEGHAKLDLAIDNGKVTTCHLSATEGARYFEGLVKNRKFYEAHEMTSRICGICSCGHVVAAVQAIEDALGFQPSAQTFRLRELLTLGERIRSHATHLYFLALPDYLGYESALAMAPTYKAELMKALGLMKIGNAIVKLLGARDLHPVSATPGGWLHLPSTGELRAVAKELEKAKKDAIATCSLFASLTHPDFDSPSEWFSLKHESEYAMLRGDFHSPRVVFECHKLHDFVREYHEDYSTANFVVVKGGRQYMLGALPRLNNNASQLSKDAKAMVKKVRLRLPSSNPYHQNLAQAIELIHAIDHAHDICSALEVTDEKPPKLSPKAGHGIAAVEVPRGTLWHEYTLDADGMITYANIITPTAQNLLSMQEDIKRVLPSILGKKKEDIVMDVEKLIRAYDPCFSCSAHFLEVNWDEH